MRLSGRLSDRFGASAPLLACLIIASGFALISCATQPPTPVTKAPESPGATTQAPPAFSRIAFAECLNEFLSNGKYDEAIASFDAIPETEAKDLSIQTLKLSILISAGKKDESMTLANELEAAYPENADVLYMRAVLADAQNDAATRAKYLNKVIAIQPNHSAAITELGLDLLARKKYTDAKGLLVKAVAADPENTDALLGLAHVYYMQSELEKAESTLNLAIGKMPTYGMLFAERARVRSELGKNDEAIADIVEATKLDPTYYGHWVDYGNYLIDMSKKAEARMAFSEAIKIKPDYHLAYIYRAGLNDDLGNTDEAISDYAKVCALFPEYYYAAEGLGVLLWGKGEYLRSAAAFIQALSRAPKNTSYALMATLCYYRANKADDAKRFMSQYITTLDRDSTEYFLCRLFVDKAGDTDVLNRITKEKDINKRNRMLFYSAMYYDLFQNKSIAQKFYVEINSVKAPGFFEFRLSQWALRDLENASDHSADRAIQG